MALDPKEFSAVVKVRAGKVYPDLVNSLALRNLPKNAAAAEGWPTYYMPSACANGHTAARFVKNDLCIDCWRVRQGRETVYPTAKNRTYYKQREQVAANGAPVIVTPAAPPAPPEPKPVEQKFLAALDETRDFDTAAAAIGWVRGMVESRASSNPVFKAAVTDLCERRSIAWTRAPDAETFRWSPEIERQFSRRYVDVGLIEQVRQEMNISASEYHARLEKSPAFAALVNAAEPLARLTLRDRATAAAEKGNDRLLKILEIEAPESTANMSVDQINAEITKLLTRFQAQGLLPNQMRHKVTGQIFDCDDLEYVDSAGNAWSALSDRKGSNADLVS